MKKEMKCKVIPVNVNAPFSKNLFGIFLESIGTCIYGGLMVDPDSELPQLCGMRLDILDALKKLKISIVRLPGGDYTDNYHWQDGIGDVEQRPVHWNGNWKQQDPNRFGTHEFIALCEYLGAEPHFVTNLGTGSVEEARAWVEYCNLPAGTKYADMRVKNGRKDPFGVKYWAVGNEPFNRGGLMQPEYYAYLYRNYAYFMRLMDPNIELVMGGVFNEPEGWNEKALEIICNEWRPPVPEHMSVHAYIHGVPKTDYTPEEYYQVLLNLENGRRQLYQNVETCKKYSKNGTQIRLSIDEYAAWHGVARDPHLFTPMSMLDAIVAARMLQYTAMMGDAVSMLCASVGINALLSLIMTKGDAMSLTPAYYAYLLMSEHIGGEIYGLEAEEELLKIGNDKEVPFVTSCVTKHEDKVVVSLVNASLSEDVDVMITLEELLGKGRKKGQITRLEAEDVHDENKPGEPEKVIPSREEVVISDQKTAWVLKKHSICILEVKI